MNTKGIVLVVLAAALAFGALVWPTQWQYMTVGDMIARVNRFTDHVQYFIPAEGWADGGRRTGPVATAIAADTTDPFAAIGDVPPHSKP